MPRTLIFGTSWIPDQTARWVLDQWVRITRKLNPDTDILLIDSASPAFPVGGVGVRDVRFPDNIGHLWKTGRDGWGRAFCRGIEIASAKGYEFAVFIEADLLFFRPIAPIIDRMAACGVGAAAPMAHPYMFIETGLMFMDLAYMREIDFIRRYDWQNSPKMPVVEQRVEAIFDSGGRYFSLPLKGTRDDGNGIVAKNLRTLFPAGCQWLHHASVATFRAFLAMNDLQAD